MTAGAGQADLERGYRRMLRWYPRSFRSESAEEILAVLLACASPGQQRPTMADRADLLVSAVRMRLGPGRECPPRAVSRAMWLMRAGAAAEIIGLVVLLQTAHGVQHAIAHQDPGLMASQWHDLLLFTEMAIPVPCGLWVWLAWANGRGHRWGRQAFAVMFCGYTLIVAAKLSLGAASYAPADTLVVSVQWLIGLAVMLLIFSRGASQHYRRGPLPAAADAS